MRDEPVKVKEVWATVGLGAGDLAGKVFLLGLSSSEHSGKTKEVRGGIETATTLLIDGTMGFRLQGWLREQGMTADHAFGVVRSVVVQIAGLIGPPIPFTPPDKPTRAIDLSDD
jgi:hypothetical protein